MSPNPEPGRPEPTASRRSNLRLGLILASVALAFALGFVAKIAYFGR